MTLYSVTDLTRVFGTRTVLEIPRLDVGEGIIYALIGPNGAGKTTLLHILAFLESPTTGSIRFRSQEVRFSSAALQKLRKAVVLVDQHPILFSTTVFKNLELGLKIRNVPGKERERIIAESLELVGMRHFSGEFAPRLSGGETQRVALARALALSPSAFLCDEPTANVDAENREAAIRILREINREKNITILFTTHDHSLAAGLADKVLMLDQGRLVESPYENLFTAAVVREGGKIRCVTRNGPAFDFPAETIGNRESPVRLFLDPEKLLFGDAAARDNLLPSASGKIVSLSESKGKIRLVVEGGIRIDILITREEYRRKRPMIGDAAIVFIPAEAVTLLK